MSDIYALAHESYLETGVDPRELESELESAVISYVVEIPTITGGTVIRHLECRPTAQDIRLLVREVWSVYSDFAEIRTVHTHATQGILIAVNDDGTGYPIVVTIRENTTPAGVV